MSQVNQGLEQLFSLKGKVALVTGGSRGIGYMISRGFLQAGAKVYITARKADVCFDAAAELSAHGECVAIPCDISDAGARAGLVEELTQAEGALDILVNNAGTAWGASYEEYPEEAFDKVLKLNVTSVFTLTRDLTPLLEKNANEAATSRVINIGSMDGLHIPSVHHTGVYAYTASKAALHHLTRHLAVELGPRHITVNAIAPGFFPSKMTDSTVKQFGEQMKSNSPLGRLGAEDDIAGIAVCLSARAGGYIHGTVIPVDGGTSINHQHARD